MTAKKSTRAARAPQIKLSTPANTDALLSLVRSDKTPAAYNLTMELINEFGIDTQSADLFRPMWRKAARLVGSGKATKHARKIYADLAEVLRRVSAGESIEAVEAERVRKVRELSSDAAEERTSKYVTGYTKQEADEWQANEQRARELTDDEVRDLAGDLILRLCEDSDDVARFLLLVNAVAAHEDRHARSGMAQIVKNVGAPYLLKHDAVVAQAMADVLGDLRAPREGAQ